MPDELTLSKAQLQRCNDALTALKILVMDDRTKLSNATSSVDRLTSERDTVIRANDYLWAAELTGALEIQSVRENIIALLAALRPVMEAVLNREIVEATDDALITLQLPDAGQRTVDGGDEPRQHVVIVLSQGALHVGQFREVARLIEVLQHGRA